MNSIEFLVYFLEKFKQAPDGEGLTSPSCTLQTYSAKIVEQKYPSTADLFRSTVSTNSPFQKKKKQDSSHFGKVSRAVLHPNWTDSPSFKRIHRWIIHCLLWDLRRWLMTEFRSLCCAGMIQRWIRSKEGKSFFAPKIQPGTPPKRTLSIFIRTRL